MHSSSILLPNPRKQQVKAVVREGGYVTLPSDGVSTLSLFAGSEFSVDGFYVGIGDKAVAVLHKPGCVPIGVELHRLSLFSKGREEWHQWNHNLKENDTVGEIMF